MDDAWQQLALHPQRAAPMCLLGLFLQQTAAAADTSPVRFLCLHNRDEFFERATGLPRAQDEVLCGRDLAGGGDGTWFGLNRATGVLVALTNAGRGVRSPAGYVSRGALVADILRGRRITPATLRTACAGRPAAGSERGGISYSSVDLGGEFAGFNMVIAQLPQRGARAESPAPPAAQAWFVTNRPLATDAEALPASLRAVSVDGIGLASLAPSAAVAASIAPGTHALSNASLDDVRWTKVRWLRGELASAVDAAATASAATAASAADSGGLAADVGALRTLLAGVLPLATHTGSLESAAHMPDLSWSSLETAQERHLQDHAFIEAQAGGVAYGTRAVALVVLVRGSLFFCYRAFGGGDEARAALPPAAEDDEQAAVTMAATPGGSCVLRVAGRDWLCVLA